MELNMSVIPAVWRVRGTVTRVHDGESWGYHMVYKGKSA